MLPALCKALRLQFALHKQRSMQNANAFKGTLYPQCPHILCAQSSMKLGIPASLKSIRRVANNATQKALIYRVRSLSLSRGHTQRVCAFVPPAFARS